MTIFSSFGDGGATVVPADSEQFVRGVCIMSETVAGQDAGTITVDKAAFEELTRCCRYAIAMLDEIGEGRSVTLLPVAGNRSRQPPNHVQAYTLSKEMEQAVLCLDAATPFRPWQFGAEVLYTKGEEAVGTSTAYPPTKKLQSGEQLQ